MTDANQVRINELARELEVKAKAIIDLLPGYGVTEKKTHSSSIPADVAEKVRKKIMGAAEEEAQAEAAAKAEKEAKEAAAKAARLRPATPVAPPQASVAPAAVKPSAPASPAAPAAKPSAPAAPTATAPAAPKALTPTPAPAVLPPAEKPAAPAAAAPKPIPIRPAPAGAPATPAGARPSAPARPATPSGTQPSGNRPAAAAPGGAPGRTGTAARAGAPARPLPTGNRGPMPSGPTGNRGPLPDASRESRPSGPRPGQPMRPQQPSQGRPFPPRSAGPGGPGGPQSRPFEQRRGPMPTGTRPGPRAPGRPGMLPPFPEKLPPKAEPGKPLYTRKPPQRQRPVLDKREQEGERKLHPTRQRPGAGRSAAAAVIAPPEPRPPRDVTITEGITIRELAEKLDVRAKDLLKNLLDRGVFASINQALDVPTATTLAESFSGVVSVVSLEEEMVLEVAKEETKESLKPRPPVVTVMGHVDHGKTSLLDAIRQADVAAGEAGGITQHIGAYKVVVSERSVVFVDTPGHEAFTRMRSRGAKVTDIVVLVVAADDGVMPQTKEAIDHAKAANVPIIVAINKIDKPNAQPERVKRELTELGLMPEEWGGQTVTVEVSARQKTNIDLLLEMILLSSDILELKANPRRSATGTVLEAKLDKGRGPVATVLVQDGTLSVGDTFIAGPIVGRVRALIDDRGRPTKAAGPSTPVEVLGLTVLPQPGDVFQVAEAAKARQIATFREEQAKTRALGAKGGRLTLESLQAQIAEGGMKELPIIIKADVQGSAEVLADTLTKLSDEKVKIRIIHSGVGAVNESDVLLASASNAIVIAFNVRPDRNAEEIATRERVEIRQHSVIYNVTDEMKKAMTGLLEPTFREVRLGTAEVRNTFKVPKFGTIAGCIVSEGRITRAGEVQARLVRDNVVVHEGKIGSLRRFKDDVSEVKTGFECGIGFERFNDLKVGDVIEVFAMERVAITA